MKTRRIIIFSDLDGTLLNHRDYSHAEAAPTLGRIEKLGIPLILCTSKTRREVEVIREEIGCTGPFISENGGGVFFPGNYGNFAIEEAVIIHGYQCLPLGIPYPRIRSFIEHMRTAFPIKGFGDMDAREVAQRTGLSLEKAALAKAREFTEPFVIEQEENLDSLEQAAMLEGIRITRGGRFFHFIGSGHDKGKAVSLVKDIFSRNWQIPVLSVALGDSPNDVPMLEQADIPILVPHENGRYEDISLPGLIRAPYPGSKGWSAAISDLLTTLGF
ncbi:MAG: HAD-IIB family hydrolase [Syntrophaceae bacterium]